MDSRKGQKLNPVEPVSLSTPTKLFEKFAATLPEEALVTVELENNNGKPHHTSK